MISLTGNWLLALQSLAIFAGILILGVIIRWLAFKWIEKLAAKSKTRLDDILVTALKKPSLLWFFLLAVDLAARQVHPPPLVQLWVDRLSLIALILSLTWTIASVVGDLISGYGSRVSGALPVTSLTKNFAKILIYVLGLLFVFQALNISITPIITALGIGGLAMALALQDTLSNLFSGMYLMIAKQVRVGDYIKLDSGQEGYVTDISWRTTTIRDLANNNIMVPNHKMAQAIIINYNRPESRLALQISISVSYEADPERVEKILLEEALAAAEETPGLLKEPPPEVRFLPGFGDSALNLTLVCQLREFVDQFSAQRCLHKRILKRFRAEGIEIPFPQRTVHVAEAVRVQQT